MPDLNLYSRKHISSLLSLRAGETKIGEKIQFLSDLADLHKSEAPFVLFGIPEDIGVRANYGRPGTATTWEAFLNSFVNIQQNAFIDGQSLILLGAIDTSAEMTRASHVDPSDPNYHEKLGDLVEMIDNKVSSLVKTIISAGKVPLIIGGGHNNAYGNIKGTSEAFGKPVNVLNIDAHTDLRKTNYRHSGNGFSFALQEGYLKNYAVYGLHQNYTPDYIFKRMQQDSSLSFSCFEDLTQREGPYFQQNLNHVRQDFFGLEVDCDVIASFPSSAATPSGLSLDEVRDLVKQAAKAKNCSYLHLCEGISTPYFPVGKALSYLITDFIKNKRHD